MVPKFKRWTPVSALKGGSWDSAWAAKDMVLTFANGSTIDFVTHGMDIGKMGGVPRHAIGYDEEPPQGIFNEGLMRLQDFDGIWVISATPQNGLDWIYDLLVEPALDGALKGMIDVFEMNSKDNPHLKAKNRDKFFIAMGEEERQIREEGKFVSRSGLVFPQIGQNLEAFIVDRDWHGQKVAWYSSVDSGWRNPTAWLWIVVFGDGTAHVVGEHYQSLMTVPMHSEIVKAREKSWGLKINDLIRSGDPAMKQKSVNDGNSPLMLYAEQGLYINVEGVPHSVEIGVEKLQQFFRLREDGKPMLTISPMCPNLIRELKKLKWAAYDSEKQNYSKNKQEVIHKKDDHAFDALRYWATQMPDLRPTTDELLTRAQKQGETIDYYSLLQKMRENDEIEFVDDTRDWDITESNYESEEMYYG
jgi:phage terminase large subunit-like protein